MSACVAGRRNPFLIFFVFFLVVVYLFSLQRTPNDRSHEPDHAVDRQWDDSISLANSFSWLHSTSESHSQKKTENISWDEIEFIPWLQSRGLTSDRIPFITMGDHNYSRAHHNLRNRLDQWGYGRDLVVLCLDNECARDLDFGYGGYINHTVAESKFAVNLELIRNGYNFVFLDGDVYLTGSSDPFKAMLPLSDDSWDIQFQPDGIEPQPNLNIGWYFARSNDATISYFKRSNDIWLASDKSIWDQEVMDKLGQKMEFEERSLKVYHLHGKRFQNFMLYDWEASLFGATPAVETFVNEATMIHYTCIEQNLKTYFGLNFGGFADTGHYYSKPPPLLAVVNVSGQSDSIHGQVAFAAQVANQTGRTLIWPDAVDIIQKVHYDATEYEKEHIRYLHNPNFPGIRALSYGAAHEAGVPVVEGRYLANQARNCPQKVLKRVIVDVAYHALGVERGVPSLEKYVKSIKPSQVAVLDFANFGPQLLRPVDQNLHDLQPLHNIAAHIHDAQLKWYDDVFVQSGMENYIGQDMFDKIRKCKRADMGKECQDICLKS